MTDKEKVDAYVKKHAHWTNELKELRAIFHASELTEEVKWGAPAYTLNGKNIAGLAAFKSYVGIWFHQGVFLKDQKEKLVNAQEGVTKAMRQWRLTKEDKIEAKLVSEYISEAIQNSKEGKELKPVRKTKLEIPPLLKEELTNNPALGRAYNKLSPGKQREYATHIDAAKREATKRSRIDKIIPMILEGQGLHDRYKNC